MMPREQFYALERRRDARWERGDDPDVETDDEDDPEDEDAAVEANAEAEARLRTIATLARLIGINEGAATALYDDQNIVGLESLRPLKDSYVKDISQAIIKPARDRQGFPFPVLSQARLKLVAYWARHLQRTSRELDDWQETEWEEIARLEPQKELEDSYKDAKAPPTPELTLDQASAAASFV